MNLFRRRNFLIDRNLQFRIIAASLGYIAFYILILAAATFIPLFIEMRSAYPDSYQAYLHANSFLYLHRHLWPVVSGILLAVSIHALFFSHKLAGPMYRFRQIFQSLTAGKIPGQQRLRKGDFLQAEMKMINEMLSSLRSKFTLIQETQRAIANSIEGIVERSSILSDEELKSLAKDLEAQGKQLAEYMLFIGEKP